VNKSFRLTRSKEAALKRGAVAEVRQSISQARQHVADLNAPQELEKQEGLSVSATADCSGEAMPTSRIDRRATALTFMISARLCPGNTQTQPMEQP